MFGKIQKKANFKKIDFVHLWKIFIKIFKNPLHSVRYALQLIISYQVEKEAQTTHPRELGKRGNPDGEEGGASPI